MNKIYRVVFNHATQSWTAVAEIARAKGKGSSTTVGSSSAADQPSTSGHLLRLSLVSSALFLAAQAHAATGYDLPPYTTPNGSQSYYCYYGEKESVICGDGATTDGTNSNGVVLGKTATLTGNSAIAIGNGTLSAVNAVSIGRDAKAANRSDIAIGYEAGLGRGDKGSKFTAGTAFAAGTVYSGGTTQTAESISTYNGISLGQNAGTNSTGVNNTMIGNAAGTQLFGDDTVSIGTNANNYRVNGFSDGTVNPANNTLDALSRNTRANNAVNRSRYSVAIGNNAMTYDDHNIAIGDGAKSLGASSIAMGTGARAGMAYATVGNAARGDGGSIAIGKNSAAPLEGDLSIGVNTGSKVNQNTTAAGNMTTTKNISVGYDVGGNVYGYTNTVIGTSSGSNIGTAAVPNYANVAIGDQVGRNIRGNNNVNIGYQGGNNIVSNSNTSLGSRSGSHISGANNVTTGTFAGTFVSGNDNWAAGVDSGTHLGVLSNASSLNITDNQYYGTVDGVANTQLAKRSATANVAAGKNAGQYVGGSKNIAFGQNAGQYVGHKGTTFGAVSNNNIAMGEQTGRFIEGNYNYASGYQAGSGTAMDATLTRNNSISQGFKANAYTNDSIAIGSNSVAGVQSANGAGKINAIAIGTGAKATGAQSISVGTGNVVSGDNSGAFGDPTTISGTGSYSVGNDNTITTNDTFVVGSNVTTTLNNSVFLGKDAAYTAKGTSTDGVEKVSDATVGGITYAGTSFASQTPVGVVSVGDVGKERRIQNVAAGLINATSTDAINGSQLYAVASTLGNQVENTYFHVNTGKNANTGNATTNLGKITDAAGATANNAVTAGVNTTASGEAAVAIGALAKAAGERSAALSAYSEALGSHDIAMGDQSVASGTYSVAIGSTSKASARSATALGDATTANVVNSVALGAYSTTIAAKGTTTDGNGIVSDATVGGITYAGTSFAGRNAQTLGVVSVGKVGEERRIQNVAAGLISATSTDAINGSQLYAVAKELGEEVQNTYFHTNTGAANQEAGDATTNLGSITSKAGATGTNAVTAGKNATAAGQNAVAVGESATANAIQVTSVGHNAGLKSTNAAKSTFIGTGAGANSNGTKQGTELTTAFNTYVGSDAGNGATGVQNTAVGGSNAGAGVTGDANAAFGHASLYNTKGNLNTGLGAYAGQNSSGDSNTLVGDNAGRYVTGNNNTALGSNAGTGTKGSDNVAIGVDAGQSITAAETVSIGKGAKAKNDKAVALGSGAVTDVSVDTKEATVNGITYGNFAGSESIATVSVGSKDNERTITNVAAGRISATSTDAINGSQLYMVADKLGTLNTEIANTYFHVNNGSNKDTGDATTNLGRITDAAGAKNVGAVTAGMNAVAETSQSIAIGQGAKAGAADRTGSSNWANIIDPRTKNPFTSEAELLAYYETVKTNPGNTVTRALIGKINNIAIGAGAVAEGGRNISIGENAGVGTADNWNIQNVNIGTEAGQNSKKDYSVAIGYRAGALTEAQQVEQLNPKVLDAARHPSILIGKQSGEGSVAYGTVAMGAEAGKDISDVRSVHNIAIGRNAGQGVSSNDGRNATFGGFGAGANTLMGASAGRNLSGDGNVAIGNLTGQGTIGDNNIMMGHLAGSGSTTDRSIIMGNQTGWSTGTNDRNVLIGNFVNGGQKANVATAVGIGNNTIATGNSSVSIGNQAKATAVNSIAQGTQAVASGENAISIGAGTTFFGLAVQPNTASGAKSVAIGYANNVTGESAIAIGTQNKVSGANAGAIGDPSIVAGAGSYTLGNDNAVGSTSTNVGAFGNNNQIGATATYDTNGKLVLANGLKDTAAVENSRAVGNKNYINTSNTYVLGSGVGTKDDDSVLGTVENSVYLGNDSTVAKGDAVGTKNLTKEGVAGTTTTAGDKGAVTTATVSGVTYGSFAGSTANGAVSVGSAGAERRVMNVAAGEISATSTDAINGSQLYMVAQGTLDQMPVIYTDTNGNKLIKSPDGNFYPAGTELDATGKPVDTTIQPVTNVIASMNDGDNIANTPKTLANVAGSLTPTYNKGDMTITDGKPTNTAAGGPTILQTGPEAKDAAKIYNNAATVGDVLNAGWNLQGNGSAQDFVKPYDTVNFADGTGTTVDVTTDDGKTSTIKVNVDAQSTVESAQTPVVYTNKEGDKLIKGDDGKFYPADSVKIGDNYYPAGTTEDENGNPVDANGDTVTALTPTGTGDIIASMNNGDNSTTAPMTLTNIASNLPNTYNKDAYNTAGEPVTTSQALPDNLNVNNAATVGDVLNAGWNLQGNGTAKDFVKPYDTVNFADGTGTTVDVSTDEEGKVSTIKVNVDAQAVTNNSQLPVVYTDKDGKQVYPIVDEDGNVTYNTQPDGKGDVVAKGDVITSINGPEGTTTPTTLTNVASNLPNTYNNDAYNTGDAPVTTEQALPVDEQGNPTLNVNNAATVGDILNAGWNLQGNGTAKDFVKPYDTVNFADGTGTTVDVSTDEEGKVSTIKVNVDAQTVTNDSQLPVVYTDKNGNQVYPIVDDQGNVTYNTQPDGKGDTVDKGDVITSINGPDGTTTPTTLTNVASNLPNTYNTDVYNTTNQPVTVSQALPTGLNVNSAATVGDILNAGWNLQGNGVAKDFVKPYDTVNFVNGNATTATVETAADGKSSTVKYDVQVDGNTIKVVDGKLTAAADSNTVTGVTAGDNITVTSTTDASGNPTYTVATKKDVTFDSVTINNGPTINADGINMNGDKITNVADGDISPTSKDAVNGSQLYSAVNNINSNIAASKEEVTSNDKSVTVTTTKNASGSNVFDLSVNTDGTTITKNADGALTVNTTPLTNNIDGSVNTPAAPNAIATAGDVANAINNSGFTLTAQGSNGSLVKPGSTVDMNNTDGNIVISKSASDNKVTYNLAKDIKVDSVTTGNTVVDNSGVTINNADPAKTVSLTENGLNNGGNRITNVAPGKDGTDAVNVNQLNQVNNNVVNLNNKVNRVDRDLRGGIAGANAAAALPQAYIPGKSMVAAAAGTYRGQSALAVGYSRISDNGKIILKLQGNTNTRGDIGGAIGVGYQW